MKSPKNSSSDNDDQELKKGAWTPEEDQKLTDYIEKHGQGSWQLLPKKAGLRRCGKSCRLRWTNYLRPDIKRGNFSPHEEQAIIDLHSVLGNKWSMIASRLPGRTDNEIKNYWNTHLRKRLIRSGIDPKTHQPILTYPMLPNSNINSLIMNNSTPLENLNKLRILCTILQVLHTNPSPLLIPNLGQSETLTPFSANIPNPLLQASSSSMDQTVHHSLMQRELNKPVFHTFGMMPRLVESENKEMIGSMSNESIVPDEDHLCGNQLVHSDAAADDFEQILSYSGVFGSEKCDVWGEVIDDGGIGGSSCWKDVLNDFFSAS